MGHVLNLACQAFLFTRNQEAVDLAIQRAQDLQREEAKLRDDDAGIESESEYNQSEASQLKWREIGPLGKSTTLLYGYGVHRLDIKALDHRPGR